MSFLEAVVLGVVQGLVEWLPLSSEGVLTLVMVRFFGSTFADAVVYSVWLHLGTSLAALIYFRNDFFKIAKSYKELVFNPSKKSLKKKASSLPLFVLVSTVLTGIVGGLAFLFFVRGSDIDGRLATGLIGVMLIITGFVLLFSRRSHSLSKKANFKDSFLVGIVQGFSIIPGVSRSGVTVGTLLLRRYDAAMALKISFILSVPAILGAVLFILVFEEFVIDVYAFVAAFISFVVGFITIKYFMLLAEKINFAYFCFILGALAIIGMFL